MWNERKISRYMLYAMGEILLVVIGILIALQVNNWNQDRKDRSFEVTLLQEIDKALTGDSTLITLFFEPRMDIKEAALDSFLWLNGENGSVDQESFIKLYDDLETDFAYRFNDGPFETIKSAGMDVITSDTLRSMLTRIYDVTLPAYQYFIEVVNMKYQPMLEELEQEVIGVSVARNEEGTWDLDFFPQPEDVLNHPAFLRILAYEKEKADNARNRIQLIKNVRKVLHDMVRQELIKLQQES